MKRILIAAIAAMTLATPATAEVNLMDCGVLEGHYLFMEMTGYPLQEWREQDYHKNQRWTLVKRDGKYEIDGYNSTGVYKPGFPSFTYDDMLILGEVGHTISLVRTTNNEYLSLMEVFVFDFKYKKLYHTRSRAGGIIPQITANVAECH